MKKTPASGRRSTVRVAFRFAASTILYAAVLFVSAGTVAWPAAWAYLAIVLALLMVYTAIVGVRHPDLIDEGRLVALQRSVQFKPSVSLAPAQSSGCSTTRARR